MGEYKIQVLPEGQEVKIETENGKVISVNDDSDKITIDDGKGNSIIVDTGGDKISVGAESEVEVTADNVIVTSGNIELGDGTLDNLVKRGFLESIYDSHTHVGNAGSPTSPPSLTHLPSNYTSNVKGS